MQKKCSNCKHSYKSFSEQPCFDCLILRNRVLWESKDDSNPYWERICAIAEKQRAKGMHTYGQGLEDNSAAILKRIEHLQEELIDGLMYCEWIKENLAKEGRI